MIQAKPSVDIVNLSPELLCLMSEIESRIGQELVVTSGYRSPQHPIEAAKRRPGEHTEGDAIDFRVDAVTCFKVMQIAMELGVNRIGVKRPSGGVGFIHLGVSKTRIQNRLWTYK